MFDTMTTTKIIGGFCGALLIFLMGGWAAETIYHSGGGGHGEAEQAYVIPVEDDGAAAEMVEEGPEFAELYAMASAADGEKLGRNCRSCHSNEAGKNGTGPYLHGVVDRAVGAVDGYNYSGALVAVAETWTPENLDAFLENPKGYAPGTAMGYSGMRSAEDRAALIVYLASLDG